MTPAMMQRDRDRPAHDGSVGRQVLAVLATPKTTGDVAETLGWTWDRAHSWVKHFQRTGRVRRIEWRDRGRRRVGLYQRVEES